MPGPRHTIAVHDGRQISAARVLAGLTVADLAKAAGTTTRTISRLEVGGAVHVAASKRHGHVEQSLWQRIVRALEDHGVELVPENGERGAGTRWVRPRAKRQGEPDRASE